MHEVGLLAREHHTTQKAILALLTGVTHKNRKGPLFSFRDGSDTAIRVPKSCTKQKVASHDEVTTWVDIRQTVPDVVVLPRAVHEELLARLENYALQLKQLREILDGEPIALAAR